MKQKVRITKQEMKEDKFTTFMLQAKEYVVDNWTYFVAGAGAVVIVFAGLSLLQSSRSDQDRQADIVFDRAMSEINTRSYQMAVVDFKTILDEFGSSRRAPMAAFNLGNAYFHQRNFSEAQAAFEHYLSKYKGDKYYVTSAFAGVASCLQASGDFVGAADKYREAAEKYPDFTMAGEYFLRAMKCYVKAGNLESARVMLAKIDKDFKGTRFEMEGKTLAGEYNIDL